MEAAIGALIRRPVGVAAFYLLIITLAIVAAIRLPVELLPSLRYPALVIWTAYPDAAPEHVERTVTEPIEEAVGGTAGLAGLGSRSQLGGSLVRLDFGWNADLDLAALDVREKLERSAGLLPEHAERPLVLRIDPSDRPVLVLAVGARDTAGGSASELARLKHTAEEVVARRLEQLEGVARVRTTGGYTSEIAVEVSPARSAAHGIELEQIARALAEANAELAGGVVRRGPFRYAVEVGGELAGVEEVAAVVVSTAGEVPIRLRDLATVRETTARRQGLVRLDGRETLLLLVERRTDANTVRTAAAVRRALAELTAELPGLSIDPVVDESVFIESALSGVASALLSGGLLSIVVLLVFLRRPRALAAVAVAVPLSLALTLVLFDRLGITLNLISLSGLALGVGMLVDNSIVVVENIARWREQGWDSARAARRGAAEVAGAIAASTLTTVAVFLPITWIEGLAGRLFRDQSLAIVCSVGASLFVALTAVPLIAAGDRRPGGDFARKAGASWLVVYERALEHVLRRPRATLLAAFGLLVLAGAFALRLPREVVPASEQGRVEVALTLATDADLALVEQRARQVETAAGAWPEVASVLADLGERDDARLELEPRPVYRGDLTLVLNPGASSREVVARLRALARPADLLLEAAPVKPQLQTLLASEDAELVLDLVATERATAERAAGGLLARLAARPELVGVARQDPEGIPAWRLALDRDAAARFGVRPAMIQDQVEAGTRGREATRLAAVSTETPVVLHAAAAGGIDRLLATRIPTAAGRMPLASFVRAESVELPALLRRSSRAPVVRLRAGVAPGSSLAAAVAAVEEVAAELPEGVRLRVGGSLESFRTSLDAVGKSLLLSVLLVYLILAAQFESLWQPWLVLTAVPMAVVGAVGALAVTGQSWNLMSLTGLTVLVGIAVNDSIVKVDFINRARREGLSPEDAVRSAGHSRFRPIVMNTLTAVLGLLPSCLALGPGGELQAPLAIVIVGGLTTSTVLTLLVLPAIYLAGSRSRENERSRA